ncbi:hypothetical protein V490_02371 [Pseudogymnoascus sp. VKM F-3557]|nr:hypothetical protein V490_02371 [Pseudogymnoascus sp. VKM F-3557]
MASFSHKEFNTEKYRAKAGILRRVRNGLDLFDRYWQTYDRVERNVDVPMYVMNNVTRFAYLLDRDPPNANFEDVTELDLAVQELGKGGKIRR